MPETYEVQLPNGLILSVKLLGHPTVFSIKFPNEGDAVEFEVQKNGPKHVSLKGEVRYERGTGPWKFTADAVAGGPILQFNDPEPKGTVKS